MNQYFKPVLIDRRNFAGWIPTLFERMSSSPLVGFDIETHDAGRHDGLNQFMKVNDEGVKSTTTKLIFDLNRTVLCGFSLYFHNDQEAFYFNINHADVENRLKWEEVKPLLEALPSTSYFISHNAPFELSVMRKVCGFEIQNILCSLQLCVTAYGPDEYSQGKFIHSGISNFSPLFLDIMKHFSLYQPGGELTPGQADLVRKVVGKESDAAYSYNGFVNNLSYGYGLKKAVESWFGHKMTTFEQVLGKKAHMGLLTGEEVVTYGCDDAYWAWALYHAVMDYLRQTNPAVIETYFTQENPMVHVYSDVWCEGMKVNTEAVYQRKQEERKSYADSVRKLKVLMRSFMARDTVKQEYIWPHINVNEKLKKYDSKWYPGSVGKIRQTILDWLNTPDTEDDFVEATRLNGSVPNTWMEELGKKPGKTLNPTYYRTIRTILFDLLEIQPKISREKKVESDGDARNLIVEGLPDTHPHKQLIQAINDLTSIEQRMKLYINPYLLLCDPQTGRMYPTLNSQLATRRMASQNPNPMQLSKTGVGTYIRGFYEADKPDHLLVSIDWSQIELVLIGEFSGDVEFGKAYGQLPYQDLHRLAAADAIGWTLEQYEEVKKLPMGHKEYGNVPFRSKQGEELNPQEFIKWLRKDAGKISNFNYWYSGALSKTAETMGWTAEQMWEAVERYRKRFPEAEAWRVGLQIEGEMNGYITLPDHHRRVKFEATHMWAEMWRAKWEALGHDAYVHFANECAKNIRRRAKNQLVNAMIQGSCSTLAKRSILRFRELNKQIGLDVTFKLPVHDELLFSVRVDHIPSFLNLIKVIMCDHKDIIKNLVVDCSASVGWTFEPFKKDKADLGQIELDEAPELDFLPKEKWGKKLDENQQWQVIGYLLEKRKELRGF